MLDDPIHQVTVNSLAKSDEDVASMSLVSKRSW
jgi:hypothetical protein